MFKPVNHETEQQYVALMEALKAQNKRRREILASSTYRAGVLVMSVKKNLFHPVRLWKQFCNSRRFKKLRGMFALPPEMTVTPANYFQTERIAVYTCITGGYEPLGEPLYCPDNCDFYVITDAEVSPDSAWHKISLTDVAMPDGLTSAEKNRYCKMFPHRMPHIGEYRYSVYLDGKIVPETDLTEFVNRIGDCGIAIHRHTERWCAYDEAEACVIVKKETKENLRRTMSYLESEGFPRGYGLLECCCIARDHENETMQSVMQAWWDMFMQYARRDQLTLPYVLYKHGIAVADVATLGNDAYTNDAVRVNLDRK